MGISGSDSYVSAMQTADSAVEEAVKDVGEAYTDYTTQYSLYLSKCAAHNLVRFTDGIPSDVYSQSLLDAAVNMSNQTRGWYHTTDSPSGTDHSIDPRYDPDHWDMSDSPHESECKGTCTVMFRSPYSALMAHREKCGPDSTTNVEDIAKLAKVGVYDDPLAVYFKALNIALSSRTWKVGCGRVWYNCDSDHLTKVD